MEAANGRIEIIELNIGTHKNKKDGESLSFGNNTEINCMK
jgi:hypothetical protein